MERKTVKLQGLNIDSFDFENALEYADSVSGQVVTINPEMIDNAVKNKQFAQIIQEAQLVIPDGVGVEIGLKILGHKVRRIAGIEFSRNMINIFAKEGKSIGFLGAKPEIIEKAVVNIKSETPEADIVYVQDGYFKDEQKVLKDLQEKQPKLLLVALGSPKQEEFIYKAKNILPDSLMIGVGGSFDVWSGVVQRAPEIYQKLGLEWLYRTIKEPARFKRIFPTLPLFALKVLNEKITGRV
ncbi:MAG: WecB/TagA/CpsF family glycosyltransferase [Candidatus Gastranaerophilaceae bacterium]